MTDLIERLRDGCVVRPKRWSGDTHDDLGGSIDEGATDALMAEAAAALEAARKDSERLDWLASDCIPEGSVHVESAWIDCEEYLPLLGRKVLVWSVHDGDRTVGGVMIAYRRPTDGQWCNSKGQLLSSLENYEHWPSHWQPLPRSPFATNK